MPGQPTLFHIRCGTTIHSLGPHIQARPAAPRDVPRYNQLVYIYNSIIHEALLFQTKEQICALLLNQEPVIKN